MRNLVEAIAGAGAPLAFDDAAAGKAVLETLRQLPDLAAAELTHPGQALGVDRGDPRFGRADRQRSASRSAIRPGRSAPGRAVRIDRLSVPGRGSDVMRASAPVVVNGDVLGRATVAI